MNKKMYEFVENVAGNVAGMIGNLRNNVLGTRAKRDEGKEKRNRVVEESKPNKKLKDSYSYLVSNNAMNKEYNVNFVKSSYEENFVSVVNLLLSLLRIDEMTKEDIAGAFGVDVTKVTDILKEKKVKALKNGLRQVFKRKKTEQDEYTIMEDTPNKIECFGSDDGIFVLFFVLKFKGSTVENHFTNEEAFKRIAEYDQEVKMYRLKQMAVYDAQAKNLWVSTKAKQLHLGQIMVEHARKGSEKERKQTVLNMLLKRMWPEATKLELVGVGVVGSIIKEE